MKLSILQKWRINKDFQAKNLRELLQEMLKEVLPREGKWYMSETWIYIKKRRVLEKEWVKVKYKLLFLLLRIDLRDNSLLKIIVAKIHWIFIAIV